MRGLGRSLFDTTIAIMVMAGVLVAAAGLWFQNQVYRDRSLPVASQNVVIAPGTTLADIARQLAANRIVAHPLAFRLLARFRRDDALVKAGEFRFTPHETTDEILRRLIEGGSQVASWLTIPEGYTARQIAEALAGDRFGPEDAFSREFFSTALVVDGQRTRNLEGYLFPDTYLIPTQTQPADVARVMTDQFRREIPPQASALARRLGYSIPQIVTIASLVEREAKADDERPLMAGVYYNRLRRGMPLQVDATIEYIFPEHQSVITRADLAIRSPYNTYLNPGLPPTPIANPGRPSLLAAFHPEASPFLYYVYRGNGHHAFAKTLAEHEANVARYLH